MAEVGIYGEEPPRESWQSEFLQWMAPCWWRCMLCGTWIFSVGALRWCTSCKVKNFAATVIQSCTTTLEDIEEETGMIVDDDAYLDSEE